MSERNQKEVDNLYKKVRGSINLKAAWDHIYHNGIRLDKTPKTRKDVQDYREKEISNLRSLQTKLRKGYTFTPSRGVIASKKTGNDIRPLVVTGVDNRIIQRSLLNLLQEQEFIKKYLNQPTSFGGISKKYRKSGEIGVEGAIKVLLSAIKDGASYYIKSDIKAFFTEIPLQTVYDKLINYLPDDPKFITLIKDATNLEIKNIRELDAKHRDLFDFNEKGTPQGCRLSSLFGNILLYDFDIITNQSSARCVRFLDDFVIVAPTQNGLGFF